MCGNCGPWWRPFLKIFGILPHTCIILHHSSTEGFSNHFSHLAGEKCVARHNQNRHEWFHVPHGSERIYAKTPVHHGMLASFKSSSRSLPIIKHGLLDNAPFTVKGCPIVMLQCQGYTYKIIPKKREGHIKAFMRSTGAAKSLMRTNVSSATSDHQQP